MQIRVWGHSVESSGRAKITEGTQVSTEKGLGAELGKEGGSVNDTGKEQTVR